MQRLRRTTLFFYLLRRTALFYLSIKADNIILFIYYGEQHYFIHLLRRTTLFYLFIKVNNTNLSVKADTLLIYLSIQVEIYFVCLFIYLLSRISISILCIKADAILEMEQRDFAREALEYVCLIQVNSYKFLSYFIL